MESFRRNLIWRRTLDWLNTYHPQIIAVTGSSGKSTTKEAIGQAIGNQRLVRIAHEPYHSPVGVALGLLGVDDGAATQNWFQLLTGSFIKEISEEEPDTIIVEVGPNEPGHIDWLAQQLVPAVTVVTNVESARLDLFQSKEMVAHEIASLVVATPPDGLLILNADDPLVMAMRPHSRARVLTFGRDEAADICLTRLKRLPHHGFALEVGIHNYSHELHLPHIIARHQTMAILAALAVVHGLNLASAKALPRLQQFHPLPGRSQLLPGKNGSLLIDDSFNATPETMQATLETLRALPAAEPTRPVRRIAILGDITNLGHASHGTHRLLGRQAAQIAKIIVAVGEEMRAAGSAALQMGADVHHFDDASHVGKWLADYVGPHDVILVAGSRAMKMEQVVQRLIAR